MLEKYKLETKSPFSPEIVLERAKSDKKADGNGVHLVVPLFVGGCEVVKIGMDEFGSILREGMN